MSFAIAKRHLSHYERPCVETPKTMYRVAKDHVSQCESIPFAEADACYFMLNVKSGVFNDSRMLQTVE